METAEYTYNVLLNYPLEQEVELVNTGFKASLKEEVKLLRTN
jgi:hypothetical protein